MRIITSWDDGGINDIRLARLLKKYKLPAIFFIPNRKELSIGDMRWISEQGFEIGGHTRSHPQDLKKITSKKQFEEMEYNKKWIEYVIGKKIDWFCYPRGRYNEETIEAVKKAGFKYARTTLVGYHEESQDNYRIHTSVHACPKRPEYRDTNWFSFAKQQFYFAKQYDGVYHLWGHSQEIEKYELWRKLEDLFKHITDN